MIGEILNENGIEDFWISARKDNMPSRKTIEKYGGNLIIDNNDICLYCAKTTINIEKTSNFNK